MRTAVGGLVLIGGMLGCTPSLPPLVAGPVEVTTTPIFGSLVVQLALVFPTGPGGVSGWAWCDRVLIAADAYSSRTLAHELTHVQQCRRVGGQVIFDLWYGLASWHIWPCPTPIPEASGLPWAFRCNPFEQEAMLAGARWSHAPLTDLLLHDPFPQMHRTPP